MAIDRFARQMRAEAALYKVGLEEAARELGNLGEVALRLVREKLFYLLLATDGARRADLEAALDALGLYWASR